MKEQKQEMKLPKLDDLFTSQARLWKGWKNSWQRNKICFTIKGENERKSTR